MSVSEPAIELILGGAKSGKSRLAEAQVRQQVHENAYTPVYIATATADDHEMQLRIDRHKADRQQDDALDWVTREVPLALGQALENTNNNHIVLVDCLTLWLNNCLLSDSWETERKHFLASLRKSKSPIFLVSNEISMGVVPLGELSRKFVDELGLLHQELSQICRSVTLVVAGLSTKLK